jgi:hypothetical protein
MARAFEESHAAYARKDGAGAKELSKEGKAHQKEMERLNAEASAWIFRGEYTYSTVHSVTPPPFSFNILRLTPRIKPSYRRKQSGRDSFLVLAADLLP